MPSKHGKDGHGHGHGQHCAEAIATGAAVCAVCGQQGARYNFGCLSCNACAAFFRRSMVYGRKYFCQCSSAMSTGEDQQMAVVAVSEKNVRECKMCRLQKCLQSGMQTGAIRSMDVWKWKTEMSAKFKSQETPKLTENAMKAKNDQENDDDADADQQQQQMSFYYGNNKKKSVKHFKPEALLVLADDLDFGLLQNFLYAEEKLRRIHNSTDFWAPDYIKKFNRPEEVITAEHNFLAKSDLFKNEFFYAVRGHKELMERDGIWCHSPDFYIRDLLISVGFAKTLPIFNKLRFEDQIILLCSQTLPALDLFISFYSLLIGANALCLPNGLAMMEMFQLKRYEHDPVINTLAQKVYCASMDQITVTDPSREEFVYLLALMFMNPCISGLSAVAQHLLRAESEKYGRALLRLQQRRLGDSKGALRYSETLRLIGCSITNAQRHRELVVYLDMVHDQGKFEQMMPKAFIPYCIMGPRELSSLMI